MHAFRSWLCAFALASMCIAAVPTSRFTAHVRKPQTAGDAKVETIDAHGAERVEPRRTPQFERSLAILYGELADYSVNAAGEPALSAWFLDRAARALDGRPPPPTEPDRGRLTPSSITEALRARAALLVVLGAAADRRPHQAATAQASFDCWASGLRKVARMGGEHCRLRLMAEMAALVADDPAPLIASGSVADPVMARDIPARPAIADAPEAAPATSPVAAPSPQIVQAKASPSGMPRSASTPSSKRPLRSLASLPRPRARDAVQPGSVVGWVNGPDARCGGRPNSVHCDRPVPSSLRRAHALTTVTR